MKALILSIFTAIIFALPLRADNEDSFWSKASNGLEDRYRKALNEATLPWTTDFADSLDIVSQKDKSLKELHYFAQHIRSYQAYYDYDSLRFVTLIDDCISLAKEYDFTEQYLCDLLNKSNFYINIEDFAKAQNIALSLVTEAEKTGNDSNLYYGYFALGSIYAETYEYDRSNDYFKLVLATFKPSQTHLQARAQVLDLLASNYFSMEDYPNAIKYATEAYESSELEFSANAIIALSYYHLKDYASFQKYADIFMASDSYDNWQEYYRTCIRIVKSTLSKNYSEAIAIKDSVADGTFMDPYVYSLFCDLYEQKGDWKSAYNLREESYSYQDSIRRATFTKELNQMDSELASIVKIRDQEKKIILQRFIFIIIILIIAIITLVTLLLMRRMRINLEAKQKELEVSNKYRKLIENAPFQFSIDKLIYDQNHQVVDYRTIDANDNMRRFFEKTNVKFGECTIREAYPESAGAIIKAINDAISEGKKSTRLNFHLSEYDQYYEMIIALEASDEIYIFSINTTELTLARKSLEAANAELVVAKEKAVRSDRAKTVFLQNMSHEIRTPLNAIVGFSQLLGLPDGFNTPEEKEEYAEYINNSSSMLTMLIDDILDVSDADKGNYRVEISDVPCNLICKVAIKNVEYRTPPGVKMYMTSEVGDDYMIHTDPRRVQQVIINYLTNACKHTTQGEIHVHISTSENPGHITFSVTDTGTGVPPEMADKIFERFTKLDAFVQGTGLGLNICSIIAEKLGGKVLLDTSYTGGARFLFIL